MMPTPNNNRKPNQIVPKSRKRVRKYDSRSRRWMWVWQ